MTQQMTAELVPQNLRRHGAHIDDEGSLAPAIAVQSVISDPANQGGLEILVVVVEVRARTDDGIGIDHRARFGPRHMPPCVTQPGS